MTAFVAKTSIKGYYMVMKHEKVLSRAFNTIAIMVMAAVVMLAIVLMHSTIEKSAEADIFRYRMELENSVRRSVVAEYKRFVFLVEIGKTIGAGDSVPEIEKHLEGTAAVFSKEGEFSNMVSGVGYYNFGSPEAAYEYDFDTEQWTDVNDLFDSKEIRGGREYFYTGESAGTGDLYLTVEDSELTAAIFFRIDYDSFFENYIADAVAALNTGFKVEWEYNESTGDRKIPDEGFGRDAPHYRFNPITILSRGSEQAVPLVVEVPGVFDVKRLIQDDKDSEDDGIKFERPVFLGSGYFIKMYHENGTFSHFIERDAAVNFIEMVIIFIIIGALIILLSIQLQRSRMLRRKEKEFVASITHELRTPLTVIRSAADNLKTGIVPLEKISTYGQLIIDQSARLGNMIEEILLYSNFENKRRKSELPVSINFTKLISELKPTLQTVAAEQSISLHWDVSGIPEKAMSHPEVVSLGLSNLITNAVNHAYSDKPGDVRISIRFLITGSLQITVEDDGRGISAREQKHIFDPFYRDQISRSRQEKGSGLGLFIVKRKALIFGGKLTVESPYRRIDGSKPNGCRFTLTLPFKIAETELEQQNG